VRALGPIAVVALAIAGCAQKASKIELSTEQETKALIIVIERGGELEVHAIDPSTREGTAGLPLFEGEEAFDLTALHYDSPLPSLGVPAGRLSIDREPSSRRSLPDPRRIWTRHIDREGTGEWTVTSSLPAAIAAFRSTDLPELDPCGHFLATVHEIDGDPIADLVPYDDEHALVIVGSERESIATDRRTRFYLAGLDGLRRVDLDIPRFDELLKDTLAVTAHRAGDGRVWLEIGHTADTIPRTAVGTFEAGFDLVPVRPSRTDRWIRWMTDSGDRLYALSDNGSLFSYDERARSWQTWIDAGLEPPCFLLPGESHPNGFCGGVAFDASGVLHIASPDGGPNMFQLANGMVRATRLLDRPIAGPRSAFAVTSLGPIAVVSDVTFSSFQVFRDGAWTHLEAGTSGGSIATLRPLAIAPHRDGFVFTGVRGFITEHTGRRLCPPVAIAGRNVARIVAIRGGVVLAPGPANTEPVVVVAREIDRR
jgi:hypothetical protein